jgi:hypothetical protein
LQSADVEEETSPYTQSYYLYHCHHHTINGIVRQDTHNDSIGLFGVAGWVRTSRGDAPHLSDQPVTAVVVLVLVLVEVVEEAVVEFGDDATVPVVGSSWSRPGVDEKKSIDDDKHTLCASLYIIHRTVHTIVPNSNLTYHSLT